MSLSLLLAAVAQVLTLIDPVIFGKIIDDYALNPGAKSEHELVSGELFWLFIAIGVALLARLAKSFQEYVLRLVVQKFGMQLFNDGLRQTLRLIIQIAHKLSTIMQADVIYVPENGKLRNRVPTKNYWKTKGCIMLCGASRLVKEQPGYNFPEWPSRRCIF